MPFPHNIDHYVVDTLIGEGDIAYVYSAIDNLSGRRVALKRLRSDSPVKNARRYFDNEATLLAQLDHPAIPAFYERVTDEVLAFEFVDGKDGETLLAEMPEGDFLATRHVIQWGVQIAGALAYLHNHTPPIAFRDLKPAHIIVDENDTARLVDFNLAKVLPESKYLANAGAVGTEGFAPPEQYQGVASAIADIYGLGATLHDLLTGIDPRKQERFIYASPQAINPAIPEALAQVVMKALAFAPEDRYQDMIEMQNELTTLLEIR